MKRRLSAIPIVLLLLAMPARGGDLGDLVSEARSALLDFSVDPNQGGFRDTAKHAKAVLVIPRLRKGGLIVGGSGGSGVLLARDPQSGAWSYPAFYTMSSVTVGAQIGGEVAQMILVVMSERGLDSLLASSVKLGTAVEVAAGPVGTGTSAATADILAYSRSKGLFGGATLEGAWVTEREGWNQEYYGQSVRSIEILRNRKVSNAQADPLREVVAKVTESVPTSQTASSP
ncbi:MAG: lipid-binding SYLF domain-containing protein [Candidatus Binatia bacterium]